MLNTYMKDQYTLVFYEVIQETKIRSGYHIPEDLESYLVMLLSYYMDRPAYLPAESFAEAYLKLKNPANHCAKELGDTCLFMTGMFPTYGSKHGLDRKYFSNIGIGSYELAAESMHKELFSNLARHFNLLSEFIELTVNQNSKSAATTKRSSWL